MIAAETRKIVELQSEKGGAIFGPEGIESPFRYWLWRQSSAAMFGNWRHVGFIMLNPSTASHDKDDPTIRRCIGFARAWGFDIVEVGNLFAYRATDPNDLRRVADPVGPENDDQLAQMARRCEYVVCAWGNGGEFHLRGRHVHRLLSDAGIGDVRALRLTKLGYPMHPLYAPGSLKPFIWRAQR